jgi:hypothetical protein
MKPYKIALSYFLLLILFTFIFWFFSEDFYHQIAFKDQAVLEQSSKISNQLIDHFITMFHNIHGDYEYKSNDGWKVNTKNARTISLKASNEEIQFTMSLVFSRKINDRYELINWRPTITWPINTASDFPEKHGSNEYVGHATIDLASAIYSPIPTTIMFPGTTDSESTSIIFIPNSDVLRSMIDFERASSGAINRMKRPLLRTFYLSAVTITTLGYGDIVPTTDFARILVALESILGIALAGLFLTAVGLKYRSH